MNPIVLKQDVVGRPDVKKVVVADAEPKNWRLFLQSDVFVVTKRVTFVRVFAIGGGGGTMGRGGGGSGELVCNVKGIPVSGSIPVTVGRGGGADGNQYDGMIAGAGGESSFGNFLKAAGGKPGNSFKGGDGGSGGGSGIATLNPKYGGSGGSAGSNGEPNDGIRKGGSGLSSSAFGQLKNFRHQQMFRVGKGGDGGSLNPSANPGGGGGGGIVFIDEQPIVGLRYLPPYMGRDGEGFGAGGGGGCFDLSSKLRTYISGGKGADGCVYVEWDPPIAKVAPVVRSLAMSVVFEKEFPPFEGPPVLPKTQDKKIEAQEYDEEVSFPPEEVLIVPLKFKSKEQLTQMLVDEFHQNLNDRFLKEALQNSFEATVLTCKNLERSGALSHMDYKKVHARLVKSLKSMHGFEPRPSKLTIARSEPRA
jgi:hypothetical protein